MGDDGYSEKRKKTWREIDQARTGGGGARREPTADERRQHKAEHSQEYKNYRKELESFFRGGSVPAAVKREVGDLNAGGIFTALAAVKQARDEKALVLAVKEFLAQGYEFPGEDESLMIKLLDHPDEAILARDLELLAAWLDAGHPCPEKQRVRLKLSLIAMQAEDSALAELAEELGERL